MSKLGLEGEAEEEEGYNLCGVQARRPGGAKLSWEGEVPSLGRVGQGFMLTLIIACDSLRAVGEK